MLKSEVRYRTGYIPPVEFHSNNYNPIRIVKSVPSLTAIVLSSHGSDDKKHVAPGRRITDALKEEKRSRCFVRTLLIKNFKYGSSLSIFVQKNNEAQRSQVSQF